jgi:rod shape-determining protein MreD
MSRHHGGWIIAFTFVVALMLTMLPLPDWAALFRPEWVAMVLIYWCMALPERVGVGIGWGAGLLLDVVKGALLGQHALALALVAYLTLHLYQRIRVYPLWQQSLFVLLMVALNQLLVLWVKGIIGEPPNDWLYWLPTLTSMLLWPWVFLVLRDLRRQFQVR